MSIRCEVEDSFFVAWTFLEKTGELGEAGASANILLDSIQAQLRTGERRKLMLANGDFGLPGTHRTRARCSGKGGKPRIARVSPPAPRSERS
jgi:hypothetical protein